jgi:hypothetical protein
MRKPIFFFSVMGYQLATKPLTSFVNTTCQKRRNIKIYYSHIVCKGQNFLQKRDPFVQPVFQRSKVNPKLLVGESEYINEHFSVRGQNALFPKIKVFFAVPNDRQTGSVMHIPGPPTHIVTYCLINRV